MSIPNLPANRNITDKNGRMTDEWYLFFSNLITALQQTISDEGILLPGQVNDNVTLLNTSASQRRILFNTTNNTAQVNLTGTFVTIQTA